MKQRAITRDDVIQVLTISKERMIDNLGHSIAQFDDNGKIVRVFFVERDNNTIVIIVYRTSKDKYRAI